jgi:hypothetical protein
MIGKLTQRVTTARYEPGRAVKRFISKAYLDLVENNILKILHPVEVDLVFLCMVGKLAHFHCTFIFFFRPALTLDSNSVTYPTDSKSVRIFFIPQKEHIHPKGTISGVLSCIPTKFWYLQQASLKSVHVCCINTMQLLMKFYWVKISWYPTVM